jgi:hypothetical protein
VAAEEDPQAWRAAQHGSILAEEYLAYLNAASEGLQQRIGGRSIASHALVLNLGPSWPDAQASKAFSDSISELKNNAWEQPAGMGICPLDTLFNACMTIHRWLALQEENVAVRL